MVRAGNTGTTIKSRAGSAPIGQGAKALNSRALADYGRSHRNPRRPGVRRAPPTAARNEGHLVLQGGPFGPGGTRSAALDFIASRSGPVIEVVTVKVDTKAAHEINIQAGPLFFIGGTYLKRSRESGLL